MNWVWVSARTLARLKAAAPVDLRPGVAEPHNHGFLIPMAADVAEALERERTPGHTIDDVLAELLDEWEAL
jgi:hypothetical protein